jgi:hypothetical protein
MKTSLFVSFAAIAVVIRKRKRCVLQLIKLTSSRMCIRSVGQGLQAGFLRLRPQYRNKSTVWLWKFGVWG